MAAFGETTLATPGTRAVHRWLASFGDRRPVMLSVVPTRAADQAGGDIARALASGADGVFLINDGIGFQRLLPIAGAIAAEKPSLFLGVNCQDLRPQDVFYRLPPGIAAVWATDAGLFPPSPDTLAAVRQAQQETGWQGVYFGGVDAAAIENPPSDFDAILRKVQDYIDIITIGIPTNRRATRPTTAGRSRDLLGKASLSLAERHVARLHGNAGPIADCYLLVV